MISSLYLSVVSLSLIPFSGILRPLFRICFLLISPALSLIKFLATLSYDRLLSVLPRDELSLASRPLPLVFLCMGYAPFPPLLTLTHGLGSSWGILCHGSPFWLHLQSMAFDCSSIMALPSDSSCSLVSPLPLLCQSCEGRTLLYRSYLFLFYLTDAQEILFLNKWVNVSFVLEIGVKTRSCLVIIFSSFGHRSRIFSLLRLTHF